MIKGILANRHPSAQFLFLIILWFLSFGAMNLVVAGALLSQYGIENFQQLNLDLQQGNIPSVKLKWMQIVLSLGMFLIPAFLMPFLTAQKPSHYLNIKNPQNLSHFLLIIPIVFFASPFVVTLMEINQNLSFPEGFSSFETQLKQSEKESEQLLKRLLSMTNYYQFLINMLMAAVVPAIAEEFFFRGVLQRILTSLYQNPHVSIIVTACIFSFIHFQFYGFLPRFFLGILFGYLIYWTGSIWYPIFAHFLHNGSQILMLYLFDNKWIKINIEEADKINPALAFTTTFLLFLALHFFYKKTKNNSLNLE